MERQTINCTCSTDVASNLFHGATCLISGNLAPAINHDSFSIHHGPQIANPTFHSSPLPSPPHDRSHKQLNESLRTPYSAHLSTPSCSVSSPAGPSPLQPHSWPSQPSSCSQTSPSSPCLSQSPLYVLPRAPRGVASGGL